MATVLPDDLPWTIYWRVGKVVLVSLPRKAVSFVSTSGCTNAANVRPNIPHGADAWRIAGCSWRPIPDIPARWMSFLERERGTEHDPRPKGK